MAGAGDLTEYDILKDSYKNYYGFFQQHCISLGYDKSRLVMGILDGRFLIFDLNTDTSVLLDEDPTKSYICILTISQNDRYAASSRASTFIFVWDLITPKLFFKLDSNNSHSTEFLLFDIQETHLISSFKREFVSVCDLTKGEQMV